MDALDMPHARSLWQFAIINGVTMMLVFAVEFGMASLCFGAFVFICGIVVVTIPAWLLDGLHPYDSSPMRIVRLLSWLQLIVIPAIAFTVGGGSVDLDDVLVIGLWYYAIVALIAGGEAMYRIFTSIRDHYKSEESIANFYDGLGFDSDDDDKPDRWAEEEEEDENVEERNEEERSGDHT